MTAKQRRILPHYFMAALLIIEFPELFVPDEKTEKPPLHVALNGNDGDDEDD